MVWPLEPSGIVELTKEAEEVLVVEEKRSFLELQVKDTLYNLPKRPRILGKFGAGPLFLAPFARAAVPFVGKYADVCFMNYGADGRKQLPENG
eukprot:2907277-Rhodomonas_salina.2